MVSTGYCVADTVDKSYKEYSRGESLRTVGITTADVFLWQMMASVFIPGFTINRYVIITWVFVAIRHRFVATQEIQLK